MIAAVVLSIGFALGVAPVRLGIVALATFQPVPTAVLLSVVIWRYRERVVSRGALFCEIVSAELRAGATLRPAVVTSLRSVGGNRRNDAVRVDDPVEVLAARIGDEFSEIGDELRLVFVNAHRSGSDAAAIFDEMGALAIAQAEVSREVRVATAPGKLTAAVLVGAPTLYVFSQLGSGGLGRLLASSAQRVVALIGLGMFSLGLAAAGLIIWRAAR